MTTHANIFLKRDDGRWEERYHHMDSYVADGLGEVLATRFTKKEDVLTLFSFGRKFCSIITDPVEMDELIGLDIETQRASMTSEEIKKQYEKIIVGGKALSFIGAKEDQEQAPFEGTKWEFVSSKGVGEMYKYLFDCADNSWSVAKSAYNKQIRWLPLDKVLTLDRALKRLKEEPDDGVAFLDYLAVHNEMQQNPFWNQHAESEIDEMNLEGAIKQALSHRKEEELRQVIPVTKKMTGKKI